jgi:hypothetical protein
MNSSQSLGPEGPLDEAKMTQENDKVRVGLSAFFNIAKLWELNETEKLRLLGQTDPNVIEAWENGDGPDVSKDTLERISYILGIFKAINILLPIPERANAWMRKPNKAPMFGGQSALERMTAGNVSDLYVVRQYLDAQLNS